jgi:phosphatidylinositol-3-phosphatase
VTLDPLRRWEQRFGSLPLPSPLVWAVMAVAVLGFGVLMGRATGPDAVGTLASARAPVKLLVAPSAPPATGPSSTTAQAQQPPPAEAEVTPEPSSTAAAKSAQPATAKKASSPSESSSGSRGSSGEEGSSHAGKAKLPAIKHVFVVMLSDEPYATAFGPASPAHYLAGTLEKQGELLVRYYAVAHEGLADGIALLSGQGPTAASAANCTSYSPIAPSSSGSDGQTLGQGCVYPASTKTLMGELEGRRLTWKAYVEGLGEDARGAAACAHPALGTPDPSAAQAPGGTLPSYQTSRNPFVYFQAIAASSACATHDVGMKGLQHDLAAEARTANLTYIAPGPCDDGSPTACAPARTSGMTAADTFLHRIVPQILSSKAYKKNGLLAITVDQAPAGGEYADSSSCCGQPRFPNLPAPTGAAALSPPGGGQVGLLMLSPFIKKGAGLAQETYNHFSLLATIEQLFSLPRLGYAGLSEVKPLSPSLFAGG